MKTIPILLALTTAAAFAQGPLAPDAAPERLMKTLDQIEPRIPINATHTPGDADSLFKITQPGSYDLTGNIAGVAGKDGIEIASGNVTLDGISASPHSPALRSDPLAVAGASQLKRIPVVPGNPEKGKMTRTHSVPGLAATQREDFHIHRRGDKH